MNYTLSNHYPGRFPPRVLRSSNTACKCVNYAILMQSCIMTAGGNKVTFSYAKTVLIKIYGS